MRSREDLIAMIREVLRHPKADLLFEIGLEQPNPTKAAQRAQREGLSNEEEKLAKKVAVFKRDYGEGWFRALREILENPETENSQMSITDEQRTWLGNLKPDELKEVLWFLHIDYKDEFEKEAAKPLGGGGTGFPEVGQREFDPQKVKEEHLDRYNTAFNLSAGVGPKSVGHLDFCQQLLGMSKEEALDHISDPEPGHENYLLVVNCLPLSRLMNFVMVDGKRGECRLNENKIEELVEVPKTLFYWRYDIEDGKAMLRKSPIDAERLFKKDKRQGLTIRETVCLAVANPDILKDHSIWAIGSRYGAKVCPYLWLLGGEPELSYIWLDYARVKWGAASARSV